MRQTYSIDEVSAMLTARARDVAHRYAPPVAQSYEDKGCYWTLNPGRADKSVGSFVVNLTGPRAGKWHDFATGEGGDLIDLIRLSFGCNLSDAFREARLFLGLQADSPEDAARRRAQVERAKALQREAEAQRKQDKEARRGQAQKLWLSAEERLRGTPVEAYLKDTRGIDLAQLGRQPRALRYAHRCFYKHIDKETGEVTEGYSPAMLAAVTGKGGKFVACHRTYLAMTDQGGWDKAPVPKPKKVLGDYWGGWINLWRGQTEIGALGKPISQAGAGVVLYIAEGIEDALSGALLLPECRFASAISLGNIGALELPPNVAEVVLIADQDEGPEARAAFQRAVIQHRDRGRRVRIWRNRYGGKDLNDALKMAHERGDHEQAGDRG